ncbi:hypothetical protein [Intrasporangium calvum]|uniref:hypothetical protein n=1 Tax=Intrasporangium calvum TaxID=53358 RepID=UPI0012374B9D|nr:hypothetical protein [Intrasporangium calvum]
MSTVVTTASSGGRRRPNWSPMAAVLTIGAGVLAYRIWQLSQSYFWQDDFIYLHRADTTRLSASFLLQDYHGHLMPGSLLVAKGVAQFSEHRWLAAASVVLFLELAKVLLVVAASVKLFGRRWGVLLPITVLLLTPMWVTPTLWWAAALQSLPLQISLLATIWLVARHQGAFTAGGLLGIAAALAFGLAFWEKAIVVPPTALIVVLLVEACRNLDPLWRTAADAISRLRWVIATWLIMLASYLALFLSRVDLGTQVSDGGIRAEQGIAALRHASLAFVVGLAGGPWRATGGTDTIALTPSSGSAFLAIQVVVVGVIALVVVGGPRRVVLALLATGVVFLVDTVAVVLTRLDLVGPEQATDPRYFTESVIVAAIAIGACLLSTDLGPNPLTARFLHLRHLFLALAIFVFANSAVITQQSLTEVAARRDTRSFVTEARAQAEGRGVVDVFDGPVPERVIGSFFAADHKMSRVLADHRLPIRWNVASSDLHIFDGLGVLRPADLKDVVADAGQGPLRDCGWLAAPGQPAQLSFGEPVSLGGRPVMLAYYTRTAGEVDITLGGRTEPVVLEEGLNRMWIFSGRAVQAIEVRHVQGAPVCVTEAKVGTVWPKS